MELNTPERSLKVSPSSQSVSSIAYNIRRAEDFLSFFHGKISREGQKSQKSQEQVFWESSNGEFGFGRDSLQLCHTFSTVPLFRKRASKRLVSCFFLGEYCEERKARKEGLFWGINWHRDCFVKVEIFWRRL